jgi:hypothetical protein
MDIETIRALGYHLVLLADSMEKNKGGKAKEEQKCDMIKKKANIKDKSEKEIMTPEMILASDADTSSTSLDKATKMSLATFFTQMSGMTLEWSVQCLEQNYWDLDKARVNFNKAKSQGKIPPEAFPS